MSYTAGVEHNGELLIARVELPGLDFQRAYDLTQLGQLLVKSIAEKFDLMQIFLEDSESGGFISHLDECLNPRDAENYPNVQLDSDDTLEVLHGGIIFGRRIIAAELTAELPRDEKENKGTASRIVSGLGYSMMSLKPDPIVSENPLVNPFGHYACTIVEVTERDTSILRFSLNSSYAHNDTDHSGLLNHPAYLVEALESTGL